MNAQAHTMKKTLKNTMLTAFAAPILAGLLALGTGNALAADGTWIGSGNANWSVTGSWQGGIIADGVGATATINTTGSGSSRSITLDSANGNRTLGILDFAVSKNINMYYTGTSPLLTFDNTGTSAAQIKLNQSKNIYIYLPMALNDSLVILNSANDPSTSQLQFLTNGTYPLAGIKSINGALTITNQSVATSKTTFNSVISDGSSGNSIAFVQQSGITYFGGAHTYTGTTTLNGGTLSLNHQLALQNSTLIRVAGGTLQFDSSVTGNAFTLGGLSATASGAGYDIALQNNAATPASITLTVGNNNTDTTYAGVLSAGGSLIKSGSGTLTLSGVNTYTGATTISNGVLLVNGSTASGSAVTVAGGTLGGSGTINGTVTVNAGATLQPSNTLTLANATAPTYESSATLKLRVSGTSLDRVTCSAAEGHSIANLDLVIDCGGLSGPVSGATIYSVASGTMSGSFNSVTFLNKPEVYTPTMTYNATTITVDLSASASPTITAPAELTGSLATTFGVASDPQSISVSGTALTANIIATAQSGFEVSSDGSTYGSTATFVQSSGNVSGTLYVRLAATASAAGSYNTVTAAELSSTGATSKNVSTTASGNSVSKADPAVTVTVGTYVYTGSPLGPTNYVTSPVGDTGTPTWSYEGTSPTSYGPSATRPTAAGTYNATVSLAADSNFNAASSSATAFTINPAPTIIAPATLPGSLATTYGTTSAVQSVSVSGTDLLANITATAQTGFEVSSDGSTFGATATFTNNGGSASGTLSVRLSATAPAAAYDELPAAILSSTSATPVHVATTASGNAVAKVTPTVTVTVGTYSFTGSAQGPTSYTTSPAGYTGETPTWSYAGTGSTSYEPSATRPTAVGTYSATVSLVADSNFNAASSSATAFSIILTPGTVSWGTPTNITSANDINSAGLTGLAGANFGNPAQPATTPESVTVNNGSVDVIFTRVGANQSATLTNGITVTTANTWVNWGYSSGNSSMTGNYGVVLDTNIGRESATPLSATITLSGLVDGMQYRIQFWASATGQAADERISGSEALNTDTGSNGQFVTGNFIADGTSQVLTVTGLAGGENFIVANALTIGTFDFTPPTLPGSSIVDDKGGMPVELNTLVTYTVTFSEDMDASTVTADDFGNAGTAAITLGSVTETSPGVFTVQVTPTNAGTLTLKVNAGADLKDNNGYALNTASAILDDTTITVYSRGSVLLIQ